MAAKTMSLLPLLATLAFVPRADRAWASEGDDGWFVYFRLYAPEQPFFDKTFTLADFEMVD